MMEGRRGSFGALWKVPSKTTLDLAEGCAIVCQQLPTHLWIWGKTSGFARDTHPDFLLHLQDCCG